MYYDIFKNYYANTQEEYFYTIGSSPKLTVTINSETIENPDNIPDTLGEITSASTITLEPKEELTKNVQYQVMILNKWYHVSNKKFVVNTKVKFRVL